MCNRLIRSAELIMITIVFMLLCSCNSGISERSNTIVMVKNEQTQSYGTGFAAGRADRDANYIVTAYSVIATVNGAEPEKAKVKIRDSVNDILADVAYCDIEHDIAVLKIAEKTENFKPGPLDAAKPSDKSYEVYGFSGTGNLMSDFETFTKLDVVKYSGKLTVDKKSDGTEVYLFSNEFNKAAAGGPAIGNGKITGMSGFSFGGEKFSQYIIPAVYIQRALDEAGVEYDTSKEILNKKIMLVTVLLGSMIAVIAVIAGELLYRKKKTVFIYLYAQDAEHERKRYTVSGEHLIGRDGSCLIAYPINEPGIGRFHCSIRRDGDQCILVDNNSKYGTFFENGERLRPMTEYPLDKDCRFYLADKKNTIELVFERSR